MRFLGIDYGTKRVGLALSDESGTLAFPKGIIPNGASVLDAIGKILKEEEITEIVVGESVDLAGRDNKVAKDIELFITKMEKEWSLPVHKQKEFLTSVEARNAGMTKADLNKSGAHSRMKKAVGAKVDASAAALILQRYLDRKNL